MHILFVCTGNTCRSPMAAFLTRARVEQRQLGWTVDSAGLFVEPGASIAASAQAALADLGITADGHSAQPVTRDLIDEADIVLSMTAAHAEQLRRQFPDAASKIYEFARYVVTGESTGADEGLTFGYDISDPFGGSKDTYERCAKHLQGLVERAIDRLERESQGQGE
jgi:protein-tyrosine-phosphatase